MTSPILELRDVCLSFGGVRAVDEVSLSLQPGSIVGLIGPNGAGKTSLVNLISGHIPPSSGQIHFQGQSISGLRGHRIARLGIARTFQIVQPFAEMSVLENVAAGALFAGGARSPREATEQAMEQLEFTGLASFATAPAANLSLANRKRLELAKSLAMRPRLLLLDEVNAGLNSGEIAEAMALIRKFAATGVTILLIEHLMRVVATLASRVIVLHHGMVLGDGTPDEMFADPRVIEAYLGAKFAHRHGQTGTRQ
jgi:branched-chain amino acid transport system ATP-binding protein